MVPYKRLNPKKEDGKDKEILLCYLFEFYLYHKNSILTKEGFRG